MRRFQLAPARINVKHRTQTANQIAKPRLGTRPGGAHPFLMGVHPEHVGLFVPQDAVFTHPNTVCASPQPGTTHDLLRLSMSREGDGILRATTEFIARYQNLTHLGSEDRNHRNTKDVKVSRAVVVSSGR